MTELSFKGKEFVYNHHLAVPFRPLVPDADKGIGAVDLGGNLIIQGDNLHALKALLPMYAGKVDCIFIDPPYNTGNEGWAYNDNVNAPMIKEWLESNPIGIEDGLRHDKWCAMMWPRLRLLHELLAEDGSIWITLDDNEAQRCKLLLDEIFGDSNFVANIIWQKKFSPANDAKWLSDSHDHLLCYAKNKGIWRPNQLQRSSKQLENYKNPDHDDRGVWASADCTSNKTKEERPNGWYYVTHPKTGEEIWPQAHAVWRFTKNEFQSAVEDNRIWWGDEQQNSVPRLKRFLTEVKDGVTPQTVWLHGDVGNTQDSRREFNNLGFSGDFQTVKPVSLIKRVLDISSNSSSIVLDSFAGSGTTAHAVLEANKRDGGNRKFILVEMEDYADHLTAERVRRVINGYDFKGTQKTELLRETLSWRTLTKAADLVRKVDGIETFETHNFDKITKSIKDNELIVTGEKTVTERTDGLGGMFTYCTLGPAIDLDEILTGEHLPSYEALGAALFHMATNRAFDNADMDEAAHYLGAIDAQHIWLLYRPDLEWLKSSDAALTLDRARGFVAAKADDKKHLVFAPARYVSQKLLAEQNVPVEFVPLPFALYRMERA
ncbi:MAG: site-specific DNA-methyltransferase [Asticcacaulis sp.]